MSSLKKFEIVQELNSKYGIKLKSVQQLNKVLQKMGIIENQGGFWHTTSEGLKYSIYSSNQVLNGDLWHTTIVNAIAKHLKSKD